MTGPDALTDPGDLLRAGSDRPSAAQRAVSAVQRHRLLVGLLVAALLLVAVLDQWQQRREMNSLLEQVASSEQSIDAADGGLRVVVDYYSPVVFRTDVPAQVQAGFRSDLAAAAAHGATQVRADAAGVDAVRILPWHTRLQQARQTYRQRVAGWSAYLDSVAGQPASLFGAAKDLLPPTQPAREALEAAVPWRDASARNRIEGLLAP